MPPKTKNPAQKGYPDQTLAEITVDRARKIAKELGITNAGKYLKDQLIPLIRDKLAVIEDCLQCGGGACCPDQHVFPADNPNSEDLDDSDDQTESSPHRSALAELNKASNQDTTVPGAAPPVSFVQHVQDQIASELSTDATRPGPSGLQPPPPPNFDSFERSFSDATVQQQSEMAANTSIASSHSEFSDDDPEFAARMQEVQRRQDQEEAALRAELERQAKDDAAKLQKKKQREKRRRAKQQQAIDEKEKRHQDRLQQLREEARARAESAATSDAGAVAGDNEVFSSSSIPPRRSSVSTRSMSTRSSSSGRSRTETRSVSFPESVRSESARPAGDSDYHPEYSSPTPRARSVSSNLDTDIIVQLMEQQSESNRMLADAIAKLGDARPNQVPISALSGFGSSAPPNPPPGQSAASSGTGLQLLEPGNPDMARDLGLSNVPLNWAFEGKMESVDLNKIKKTMVSGKHRSNQGLVLRQQYWPHDCVSAASAHLMTPVGAPPTFDNISFAQYQEGMIQKILLEAPASLDVPTINKLKFQSFLIKLAYSLTWEQVRSIGDRFIGAWENKAVNWSNWDAIKAFLTEAAEQTRLSAILQPSATPGAVGAAPRQPNPKPGNPNGARRKWVTETNGVPWSYMKSKGICCQFNHKECPQKTDHKIADSDVHHWCGGCFATSKGSTKEAHPALSCKKGPFNNKSLFS